MLSALVDAPRRDLRSLVETVPKRVALTTPTLASHVAPITALRKSALASVAAPDVIERVVVLSELSTNSDTSSSSSSMTMSIPAIPLDELTCGVCFELLASPMRCRNHHVFCHTCGLRCAVDTGVCPICRCVMTPESPASFLADSGAEAKLSRVRIRCRFAFNVDKSLDAVDGCRRLVPLAALPEHEAVCGAAWRQCAFAPSCTAAVRPSRLDEHAAVCDARPVACALCGGLVPMRELATHARDACRAAPSGCSLCAWTGTRAEFYERHVSACDSVFVPCEVCDATVRRGELAAHNGSSTALHIDALSRRCQELALANETLRQQVETLGALPTRHRFTVAAQFDTFAEAHRTTPPLLVDGLSFALRLELTADRQCAVSLLAPANLNGTVTVKVAVTFSSNSGRQFASRRQAVQFASSSANLRAAIGFVAVARDWLVQQCGFPLAIVVDLWIISRETIVAM
jgi:hypothetical protein